MSRYRANPLESTDAASNYIKNIAENGAIGLACGALGCIVITVAKNLFQDRSVVHFLSGSLPDQQWAIRLLAEMSVSAAVAAASGPIAYQLIQKANEGSNALSRLLGLKKTFVLPKEAGTTISTIAATALARRGLGFGTEIDFSDALFKGMILPDLLRNVSNHAFITSPKATVSSFFF